MRHSRLVSAIAASLLVFGAAARAEVVRTIRAELPASDAGRFAVENLAGRMHVAAGGGGIVAIATVHADDERLASSVRLERVDGEDGAPTLRVRYPADEGTLRYPRPDRSRLANFLDVFSSETQTYAGERFRVSESRGKLLYADVEVEVPQKVANAVFRNLIGRLEAEGLQGRMRFAVASADVRLERVAGELELQGGSGDVRARDVSGTWESRFGSGDCRLDGFRGESARFDTGSGDVHVEEIEARRLEVETGSGDSRFLHAKVDEFIGQAGSGDIELDARDHLPASVRVKTSSGNALLRLPRDASFQATARHGSGDVRVRYDGVVATIQDRKIEGYRRGENARLSIDSTTGSGDLTITP